MEMKGRRAVVLTFTLELRLPAAQDNCRAMSCAMS